jgi:hypothetical protein
MPIGKEPGEDTQSFAAAGKSRTDRPDWQVKNRRDFAVSHTLQSGQQNNRTLFLGQFRDGALQIAQLEPRGLVGRESQIRVRFLQFDIVALSRNPAGAADMLVVQDRE